MRALSGWPGRKGRGSEKHAVLGLRDLELLPVTKDSCPRRGRSHTAFLMPFLPRAKVKAFSGLEPVFSES